MYYYFYHGSDLCEIMWNQFLPNLSCLQNNPPENNVEDLAGTRSTLFSSGLFWDRFLLDLIKKFFWRSFLVQIDVILLLPRVLFTRNHPIFTLFSSCAVMSVFGSGVK